MTILDRYLLWRFTRNLLMVLLVFVAVYILVDFFERIDEFIQAGKPLSLAARFLLLKIPFMVQQLMPVSILLAGVITLGLLNHHGELAALNTAGLPLSRIVIPLLACALTFSLVTLTLCEWLLPPTITSANRILHEEVRGEIPKGIHRQGRYYYNGREGFYTFLRPDPDGNRYLEFSYAAWDGEYRLTRLLRAASAAFRDGRWLLKDCRIKQRDGQNYTVNAVDSLTIELPETPDDFFIPKYRYREMSLSELLHRSRAAGTGTAPEARYKFYELLSYVFLGLPLLLIGMPILLLVHQRWGRDLSVAVPISCGLAFAAWGGWGTLQSLARADLIPLQAAAWLIHLAISAGGVLLLGKLNR